MLVIADIAQLAYSSGILLVIVYQIELLETWRNDARHMVGSSRGQTSQLVW